MYIYKDAYEKIDYLRDQSENFLAWICPQLQQVFIPIDQYLYYETDQIIEIYFVQDGMAGFVLPFQKNIVYITIRKSDYFGEVDLVVAAKDRGMKVEEMFETMHKTNFNLTRQFTVQAIQNCKFLTMSLSNLSRMHKQFNS